MNRKAVLQVLCIFGIEGNNFDWFNEFLSRNDGFGMVAGKTSFCIRVHNGLGQQCEIIPCFCIFYQDAKARGIHGRNQESRVEMKNRFQTRWFFIESFFQTTRHWWLGQLNSLIAGSEFRISYEKKI